MVVYCPLCGFKDEFAEAGCMFTCQKCKKMSLIVPMLSSEAIFAWIEKGELRMPNGTVYKKRGKVGDSG